MACRGASTISKLVSSSCCSDRVVIGGLHWNWQLSIGKQFSFTVPYSIEDELKMYLLIKAEGALGRVSALRPPAGRVMAEAASESFKSGFMLTFSDALVPMLPVE